MRPAPAWIWGPDGTGVHGQAGCISHTGSRQDRFSHGSAGRLPSGPATEAASAQTTRPGWYAERAAELQAAYDSYAEDTLVGDRSVDSGSDPVRQREESRPGGKVFLALFGRRFLLQSLGPSLRPSTHHSPSRHPRRRAQDRWRGPLRLQLKLHLTRDCPDLSEPAGEMFPEPSPTLTA